MFRVLDPYGRAVMNDLFSKEFNSFFELLNDKRSVDSLGVDIWDNSNELIIRLELPGVAIEDIQTTINASQLDIEAQFKDTAPNKEEGKYLRKERREGNYKKSIRLPYDVETEKVEAEYKDGILKITLPKAESNKPKVINVKRG
jgi:HSP20 family protein